MEYSRDRINAVRDLEVVVKLRFTVEPKTEMRSLATLASALQSLSSRQRWLAPTCNEKHETVCSSRMLGRHYKRVPNNDIVCRINIRVWDWSCGRDLTFRCERTDYHEQSFLVLRKIMRAGITYEVDSVSLRMRKQSAGATRRPIIIKTLVMLQKDLCFLDITDRSVHVGSLTGRHKILHPLNQLVFGIC